MYTIQKHPVSNSSWSKEEVSNNTQYNTTFICPICVCYEMNLHEVVISYMGLNSLPMNIICEEFST